MPNTQVLVIVRKNGLWVFDDRSKGLKDEPFVTSATMVLDHALREQGLLDDANSRGCRVIFSGEAFRGSRQCQWVRAEDGGNVYQLAGTGLQAWLCPALFKYFTDAPASIYFAVMPMS